MNKPTKIITRAGVLAALYVALTLICAPIAFGPIQFRPAEGLTVFPVFFIEGVPALFVGCLLANLFSYYGVIDCVIGGLTTLIAAALTYIIYRKTKNVYFALFPQVLLNALFIPVIFLLTGSDSVYYIDALIMFATETIYVYGFGVPLYYAIKALRDKGNKLFID